WSQVSGIFRAINVLYIIWGALLFFRVTEADGTLHATSSILQRLTPSRELQVLLLAWGFTGFLQGVGGFGVPVAVVAPILVTMGFLPLQAVVMASLGHAWAISFGSLGASYEALISATGLSGNEIGPWMAIFLGLVCYMVGGAVLFISGGKSMLRQGIWKLLSMATVMSLVQYGASRIGLANIAAMLGALAGIITGSAWAVSQLKAQKKAALDPDQTAMNMTKNDWSQLIPYGILLVIIFAVNFILPLKSLLNLIQLQVTLPALELPNQLIVPTAKTKGISIFGHAGALLIYAGLMSLFLAYIRGALADDSMKKIKQGVLRSGFKSSLGILAMMAMATTMQTAGMVSLLSSSMASISGLFYPLVSPFIGALGAFMTGSNTNSNVLFGAFQQAVAKSLDLHVPLILAIHNAGAAVGSVFAPAKIIVGCSTVGLEGQESEALRSTTKYGLIIIGVLALIGYVAAMYVRSLAR
ncbi:MAG: L-lactate permease, partial [Anaerolineae bacterium]|nr:L-lactate permease [Anaerolineae bacterium]